MAGLLGLHPRAARLTGSARYTARCARYPGGPLLPRTVTLIDEDTDEKNVYQIVGEDEADIKSKRLAITAPLARALVGKTVGDTVEVTTPGGSKSYEISKVQFK